MNREDRHIRKTDIIGTIGILLLGTIISFGIHAIGKIVFESFP